MILPRVYKADNMQAQGTSLSSYFLEYNKFLEDLDLLRSEHCSVSTFLSPFPDFPTAKIFVACRVGKRESLVSFCHKHGIMEEIRNRMSFVLACYLITM